MNPFVPIGTQMNPLFCTIFARGPTARGFPERGRPGRRNVIRSVGSRLFPSRANSLRFVQPANESSMRARQGKFDPAFAAHVSAGETPRAPATVPERGRPGRRNVIRPVGSRPFPGRANSWRFVQPANESTTRARLCRSDAAFVAHVSAGETPALRKRSNPNPPVLAKLFR